MSSALKVRFTNGLWHENPGLVQLLGLCPLLAVTVTFVNGLGLGIATLVVLMASNALVSATRRWIQPEIRIPIYVLIIASLVTCIELILKAWFPALDRSLGIFVPLIVTNCAIVARAEVFAIVALLTSMLSAVLGMGGGILLLATMFCFLSHADSIPTHAAVQIASNGTRVMAFMRNVDWRALRRFVCGAVPGAMVGMYLLWVLGQPEQSEPYLKTLVGAFILVATYLPKPKGDGAHRERHQ